MDFLGKRVVIAGSGVSGQGAQYALCRLGAVCSFYPEGKASAELMVVSPGIPPDHECFAAGIPVIGEFGLGALLNDKPVVAVTGTNGKTTVCEMLGEMLSTKYKTALVGNIGQSFARAAVVGGYEVAVAEVSSFQLEHIENFCPAAAAVLNVSPDHLDRYPDFAAYGRAKLRIAESMRGGLLVLGCDDIPSGLLAGFTPNADVRYVSARERVRGGYIEDGKLYANGAFLADRFDLKCAGDHNVKNALTAALLAEYMGVARDEIVRIFKTFEPDDHRIRAVGHKNGVSFYNDSKGTNVEATLAAVRAVGGRLCLIAGGSEKGLDYDDLFSRLPSDTAVVLMGETAPRMQTSAERFGFKPAYAATMRLAVETAFASGCPSVLLSPAAASFDMYKNYAARGEDFVKAVRML